MNHIIAIIATLIAMIFLVNMAIKMRGGMFSKVILHLNLGIFFAVFVHSIVEYFEDTRGIPSLLALDIMSGLLILGSIFFCIGGWYGYKALKG